MDATYLEARITKTQDLITAYEDALVILAAKGAQSYTLNTGEAMQVVTHKDAKKLEETLDGLYNRLATLEARRYGAAVQVKPGW
jgi:hypothetical protein